MLRIILNKIILLLLFSLTLWAENFERLCDDEVMKKDFNVSLVKEYCENAGNFFFDKQELDTASWYYLLSGDFKKNIDLIRKKNIDNSLITFTNIAHSYVLTNDFKKAKIAYENANLSNTNQELNEAILTDYKLLFKLYSHQKKLLEKGLKLWKNIHFNFLEKEKKLKMMLNYYNQALSYESKKNYQKAIKNYQKSLKLALKILDKNHMHIGIIYNSLGLVHTETKDYKLAVQEYEKSLNIFKKIYGKNDSELAIIYNNLAVVYEKSQEFDKAIQLYQTSIKIQKETHSNEIIDTFYNLALLYQKRRQYAKAFNYYKEALPFIINNSVLTATHYNLLGRYYQEIEDNNQALSYYQKALKIREKEFGKESIESSDTYNNLGSIYEALRDYEQALVYYKKSLKISQKILNKNDLDIAIIYNNIASAYNSLEKYSEAKKYILKTLEMKNNVLKSNDIDFAVTYTNLGFIYENLNSTKKASMYYNKALTIYQTVFGEESLEVAITYNNIASLYQSKQEYKQSLKYLKKSNKIMNKILTNYDSRRALIYNNLGLLYEYNEDYEDAYKNNNLSFKIFLRNRNNNFQALDRREKEKYLKSFGNRTDNLLNSAILYIKEQKNTKKVTSIQTNIFNHWLNYKGTLFQYQNILSMLKNTPKVSKKIKDTITDLTQNNVYLSSLEKQFSLNNNEIKKVKKSIHQLEITLSEKNDLFKNLLKLNNIKSSQIASKLKKHQLYIDFVRGTNNYYIFTLDSKNHVSFQQLDENETKAIDANINTYVENTTNMSRMISENSLTIKGRDASKLEAQIILKKLYATLIEKYLKKYLTKKTHLIISPDGALNFLPFEALYDKEHYLIENYQISYISSGKEFLRQINRKKSKNSSKVVVFGSPDFWLKPKKISKLKGNINNTNATIFDIKFEKLTTSKKEIEIMKKYYPELEVYEGNRASIENLFKLKSPKILHISTHGFFLKNKNNPNPMLSSGLAFAGANYAHFKDDARGIAIALQLTGLNLENTELVVLSACETALGEIHNAEGVAGLSKAFIQAGAKQVVISLWKVSVEKTITLMQYFYANIHVGKNYADALRQAKLQMIKMHPYYWSAFIMSGI